MRPARDGLILNEGGAEAASYSAAAQAVLLTAVVPLYGWLGTRVRPRPAHRNRDDVFLGHARRLLHRRPDGAARRRGVLHLDRTHQRVHRVAVLGLRERPVYRGPGAPAVSVHRRRPVARCAAGRRSGHAARPRSRLHAVHADAARCVHPDGGARDHAGREPARDRSSRAGCRGGERRRRSGPKAGSSWCGRIGICSGSPS